MKSRGGGERLRHLVVLLDGALTCRRLPEPSAWRIWWGANLGVPDEQLVAGRLDEVADQIWAQRTAAKQSRGWVMDTYVLRRVGSVKPPMY